MQKKSVSTFSKFVSVMLSTMMLVGVLILTPVKAAPLNGWIRTSTTTKFYVNGVMKTSWVSTGGKKYFFDNKTGNMLTGWITTGGKRFYLSKPSGYMVLGWAKIGVKTYYLTESGMLVNTVTPNEYNVNAAGEWDGKPKPVIFTFESMRTKLFAAGLGKNLHEKRYFIGQGTYSIVLNYNASPTAPIGTADVFYIRDRMDIAKIPNIDFYLVTDINNTKDPAKLENISSVHTKLYEIILPGQSERFKEELKNVKLRLLKSSKGEATFPTVLFFGGRRIFVTPSRENVTYITFSAIGDASNIWTQLAAITEQNRLQLTSAELKAIMPELKNY